MSILQGDNGTTLDDLMVSCLGHIFGTIETAQKNSLNRNRKMTILVIASMQSRSENPKKKTVDSKRIAIKATEDKILAQWRFTVLPSPKVMAIQAQRDKNLADDLTAKATKKQA